MKLSPFSREESDATGWISICDLYLLFAAVLLALGLSLAGRNDRLTEDAVTVKEDAATVKEDAATVKDELQIALSTVRRLEPRARELEETVRSLERDLKTADAEIDSMKILLAAYGDDDPQSIADELTRLKTQRDQGATELKAARAEISELEATVNLDAERNTALQARLKKVKSDYEELKILAGEVARIGPLEKQIAAVQAENKRLQELAGRAAELADVEVAFRKATRERDEKAKALAEATRAKESLREQLRLANQRLSTIKASSVKREELVAINEQLRSQLSLERAEVDSLKLKQLKMDERIDKLADTNSQFEELEQRRTVQEGGVRQELLGLSGSLRNVVFLMDRSQTMGQSGRWQEAVETLKTWLRHLPVENAAVIAFHGGRLDSFPARDYAGRDAGEFEAILDDVGDLTTGGSTNTYEAVEQAFRYDDLDSIILFTDGRPDGKYGVADVLKMVAIERKRRPNVVLHVIGVGDYFDGPMKRFLLGLREAGGGKFIGQ